MFPNHASPYAFIRSAYMFTNTDICENTIIWYSSEITEIDKSTDFGTFTEVPFAGIFTDFGVGTDTGTGNLRYRYRYRYRNTDNNFVPLQYRYRNTGRLKSPNAHPRCH